MKKMNILGYIARHIRRMGAGLIYAVLLMYFAYRSENTPAWAKKIILGTLAYVLSPIDSIPDLTPVLGFTDDMGVISFGLVSIACYINQDVRNQSRQKLYEWIKNVDEAQLIAVDRFL
jgi:uncharacterized membrane protein YkvA (DUF1232 family)